MPAASALRAERRGCRLEIMALSTLSATTRTLRVVPQDPTYLPERVNEDAWQRDRVADQAARHTLVSHMPVMRSRPRSHDARMFFFGPPH